MSKVLILDCKDYNDVDKEICKVFEEFPNQWKGKKILLKPNMLNSRPPERGNTTHPSIIRSAVKWLTSAGAQVIVGDNSGSMGPTNNEICAEKTGIAEASMGCFINISQDPVTVETTSRFTKQFIISKAIIDVDMVISLPKFKTHSLTLITGAIKNSFGFLVGGEKQRIHAISGSYKNFAEIIVDVYQIRVPDLVIMDAIIGMEGNGPSSGNLRHIGKIIASNDGVAVDAIMATMMGKKPEKIFMLKVANQRKLGEIDISKMNIIGELSKIKGFKMPSTFICHVAGRLVNNRISGIFFQYKPAISKDKCNGCGVCAESCPVNAISMIDNIPVINRKICIRCYCCQELCPSDVIELRRLT